MIVNAPMSRLSRVGAVLVIVTEPDVSVSIIALEPDGPAAVEEVPPGLIDTLADPRSTSSRLIESRE